MTQAYPTCPQCGLIIGDKGVHDYWHRRISRALARIANLEDPGI